MRHCCQTTLCCPSFATVALNVRASALAPAGLSNLFQSTLSLFGLRFCHVKSGRSIIVQSAVSLEPTLSSRLLAEKNLMRVLLSSRSILRSAPTASGTYCILWFRLLLRTLSPRSKRFAGSSMLCSTFTHLCNILLTTLLLDLSLSIRRSCSTAPPKTSFCQVRLWIVL